MILMKMTLINGDAEIELNKVPLNSIDLIITSPPYFEMRGEMVWDSYDDYLLKMYSVCEQIVNVTKPGRCIAINVGDYIDSDHIKRPLPSDFIRIFHDLEWKGVQYEDSIIWEKAFSFGMGAGDRAGMFIQTGFPLYYKPNSCYEVILIFRKGKLDYSQFDKSQKVDYEKFRNYLIDIWHMRNMSAYQKYAEEHIAQFPPDLPRGIISLYSLPGEIVCDPFLGSGTTMEVCRELERDCIGIEINPKHIDLVKRRMNWGSSLLTNIEWKNA
jgi:DNA modification methylase